MWRKNGLRSYREARSQHEIARLGNLGFSVLGFSAVSSHTRENAAREALSLHSGRTLTEAEWTEARVRLLAFVTILRRWNEKANTPASGIGNV